MDYVVQDGVAVLMLDNPPVNALTQAMADELGVAVEQAVADSQVRAMVIAGAGRTFVAGADIAVLEEMAWGRGPGVPRLHGLLQQIEDSPKPVVMALHGTALGGGLELAMAGHYRVALASAQLGLPEVMLGIIPGAEGTQRLPRLVGVAKAVEMITGGKPVGALEAQAMGLVDEVYEDDLPGRAIRFAQGVSGTRPTRELPVTGGEAALTLDLSPPKRRQMAPRRALEAIEAAVRLPFAEGCRREFEIFEECVQTDQAKALMHVFFAERAAGKVPGLGGARAGEVGTVGILGAGTMGGGIAMAFASAGIPVLLRETRSEALEAGLATIRRNYDASVKRGRLSAAQAEQQLALIRPQLDLNEFGTVDVVVEAAFEDMALKKQIFGDLDAVARPGCLLATNTSSLNIDEIAAATKRPEWVLGLHFFSPVPVMRLLEIVRGRATSAEALTGALAIAKRLRKVGVVAGNCPGFIGNRMFYPYLYEAHFLAEEGATPGQVDKALTEFGMAMGPFAVDDLSGIDVGWRVRQELGYFREAGVRKPLLQERLFEQGRWGQKTAAGWYRYGADRKAVADPKIEAMLAAAAEEAGIARRTVADEEIVRRTIYRLINEGARILDEGFAARASDIDVVYVNGYGFPNWRGGPMMFADLTGLSAVLGTIQDFHRKYGARWEPAPLLQRLAAEGKGFREFDRERNV